MGSIQPNGTTCVWFDLWAPRPLMRSRGESSPSPRGGFCWRTHLGSRADPTTPGCPLKMKGFFLTVPPDHQAPGLPHKTKPRFESVGPSRL